MNWRNAAVGALLLAATVLTIFFAVRESSAFKQCNADDQQQESTQQLKLAFRCTGYFVKKNESAITAVSTVVVAIFTIVLGVFTISLAHSTRIAADAARDQTLNFAKLERPYLYVFNPSGLKIDHDQEDPFHYLKYSVANYGKTPARVESASIGINVGVEPKQPDAVVGWHDFLVSPLFVTGERRDNPTVSVPDEIEIGDYADEDTPPFPVPWMKGEDQFFFWIRIKYSGPFSKDHETSACWRWDGNSHRLVLYEKHNSQT